MNPSSALLSLYHVMINLVYKSDPVTLTWNPCQWSLSTWSDTPYVAWDLAPNCLSSRPVAPTRVPGGAKAHIPFCTHHSVVQSFHLEAWVLSPRMLKHFSISNRSSMRLYLSTSHLLLQMILVRNRKIQHFLPGWPYLCIQLRCDLRPTVSLSGAESQFSD